MKLNLTSIEKLNLIKIMIPLVFIVAAFFISINRTPFFDEAHAYLISRLNLKEILYMTRTEGHPVIWYLILKPFSSIKLYPYPMLVINWLIGVFAVLFLWFKSPFNTIEKTLIIFSYPFFSYFAIVARPYALTLVFMFFACYFLGKNRPVMYAFILLFLMNTTLVGMISAFCFGLIFIYNLIKEKNITKKQAFILFGIFIFEVYVFVLQFIYVQKPVLWDFNLMANDFKSEFYSYIFNPFLKFNTDIIQKLIFKTVTFILLWVSVVFFFKKSKTALFYFIISNTLLTFVFLNIYIGAPWHYYFYFINFIVSLWLCYDEIKNIKLHKFLFTLFLILLLNPYSILSNGKVYVLNTSKYMNIKNDIVNFHKTHEGKYFCLDVYSSVTGVFPYLKKEKIDVYNLLGMERTSFYALASTFKLKIIPLVPKDFASKLDKTKDNYLLASMFFGVKKDKKYPQDKIYEDTGCKIKFVLEFEDRNNGFAIYKIEAEEK